VNINEEPYAGKPQVRFCEGNKSSHNYLLGENYMTTRQNYKNIVNSLISFSEDSGSLKKNGKIFRFVMFGVMIFASLSVNFIATTAQAAKGKKFLQRYSCTVDKKMENHKRYK
jgi:hypothetical protein